VAGAHISGCAGAGGTGLPRVFNSRLSYWLAIAQRANGKPCILKARASTPGKNHEEIQRITNATPSDGSGPSATALASDRLPRNGPTPIHASRSTRTASEPCTSLRRNRRRAPLARPKAVRVFPSVLKAGLCSAREGKGRLLVNGMRRVTNNLTGGPGAQLGGQDFSYGAVLMTDSSRRLLRKSEGGRRQPAPAVALCALRSKGAPVRDRRPTPPTLVATA